MDRESVLRFLIERREELRARFGVGSIGRFGSYARDEARPDSDVDLLVEFETRPTFLGYMGLTECLEDLFGTRVDIATRDKLKARIRPSVKEELIRVA
jgi:predicted nucleotidyltransferase